MAASWPKPPPPPPSRDDPEDGSRALASERESALRDLLSNRYRLPMHPGEAGALAAPAFESLLSHRSVRRYLPKALPESTIELLVAAAQSASSSSNLQLWSVIDVRDPERRRALGEVAGGQAHILECATLPCSEPAWAGHTRTEGVPSNRVCRSRWFCIATATAALPESSRR